MRAVGRARVVRGGAEGSRPRGVRFCESDAMSDPRRLFDQRGRKGGAEGRASRRRLVSVAETLPTRRLGKSRRRLFFPHPGSGAAVAPHPPAPAPPPPWPPPRPAPFPEAGLRISLSADGLGRRVQTLVLRCHKISKGLPRDI